MTRRYHREGNGRRSRQYPHLQAAGRRPDTASQFVAAGFEMTDWNKFRLVVKNRTYNIAPCAAGLRITGRTVNGAGLVFPYGHPPAKIALYLSNLGDNPVEAD